VIDLLSELDEKFGDIASKAPPPVVSHQTPSKATVTAKTTNTKHSSKGIVATTTTTSVSSDGKGLSVGGGSGTGKRPPNKARQSNQRTCDAERKRLKKELDKLMKAHKRASKALDDFRNEKVESR
jgi:hypothetical protein